MKKRALFIDRDGTLIVEPPVTSQTDDLELLEFLPGVIRSLFFMRQYMDFELVMISSQAKRDRIQRKMLQILANENICFDHFLMDKSHLPDDYDLAVSYLIGDSPADMELAANAGCQSILIAPQGTPSDLIHPPQFTAANWEQLTEYIFAGERKAVVKRTTKETDIFIQLDIDGSGKTDISTGIGFFDHLLDQIGRHSGMDLTIHVKGDLHVDEHHTIEDTAIALGEALWKALGSKRGIERYGFCLPMDDCLCSVALDFGGRAWLVFDATFKRDRVGEMPSEMIPHFFKSLSDAAKMNLNIKAEGENEHHKAEGIFKALAKAIKMAVKRDIYRYELPSTKGML